MEFKIVNISMKVIVACACIALASGRRMDDELSSVMENELANPFEDALLRDKLEMDTGYIDVRRGVSMFWWLFYADGQRAGAAEKPVIVWVQGGPGLPASGIGNFMEIGPLDLEFRKRNHSWVYGHNLLLIDSPAGTGFSKVDHRSLLISKDKQVVKDFVNTVAGFLNLHPEFRESDWHIFSQSYGGKLAPKIGYRLDKAISKGRIQMNLKTVAIGSGFVDPSESITASADYMYHMGLIDLPEYDQLKMSTDIIGTHIRSNRYEQAFLMNLDKYEGMRYITSLNKNNVNEENNLPLFYLLERKVNTYVMPVLNSTRGDYKHWESLSSGVYMALHGNMMLPSKKYVEKLLNETSLKVVVYNGNFDAVTPMAGCVNWVHNLHWPGAKEFGSKQRQTIAGNRNGYVKKHGNLSMWWVLGAGHWVPNDNPSAMKEILKYVTGQEKTLHAENAHQEKMKKGQEN